ncbi:hypothetical protein M2284_003677 [Rhodococcus sp. LBL1]|nr:hypothetical protein [Rhodococcus sp. LBL1]
MRRPTVERITPAATFPVYEPFSDQVAVPERNRNCGECSLCCQALFTVAWSTPAVANTKEEAALREAAHAIKRDYPQLSDSEVDEMIARAVEDFHDRPIREFVPLFVERRIRSRLSESD